MPFERFTLLSAAGDEIVAFYSCTCGRDTTLTVKIVSPPRPYDFQCVCTRGTSYDGRAYKESVHFRAVGTAFKSVEFEGHTVSTPSAYEPSAPRMHRYTNNEFWTEFDAFEHAIGDADFDGTPVTDLVIRTRKEDIRSADLIEFNADGIKHSYGGARFTFQF